MEPNEPKIWFPAKRYGWGWGPPNCWQGWAVIAVWAALLCGGAVMLMQMQEIAFFILYMLILQTALILVCLRKGEKPRWRWGKG